MSLTINDLMLRYYRNLYAPSVLFEDPIPVAENLITDPQLTSRWSTTSGTVDFSGEGLLLTESGEDGYASTYLTLGSGGDIAASPGDIFSVRVNAEIEVLSPNFYVTFAFKDSLGAQIEASSNSGTPFKPTTERKSYTFTSAPAPAGTTHFDLYLYMGTDGPTSAMRFTNVIVTKGSVPSKYFDGDSKYAAWTGARHNSTSILYMENGDDRNPGFLEFDYYKKNSGLLEGSAADHERKFLLNNFVATASSAAKVIAKNLVKNPALTTINGWGSWAGTGGTSDAGAIVANGGTDNGPFFRVTWSVPPSSGGGAVYSYAGDVKPGDYIAASVWVRSNKAITMYLSAWSYDSNNASVGNVIKINGPNISVPANTWTEITGTFQVDPAHTNANKVQLRIYAAGAATVNAVNDTIDFDTAIAEVSQDLKIPAYFDGDSPNAYWEGSAGNSNSVLLDPESLNNDGLQRERFVAGSGLTPPEKFSMADHEYHFYKNALGL